MSEPPRSLRLAPVFELALREEERAVDNFTAAQKERQNAQQRLIELQDYYREYQNRFDQHRSGVKPMEIRHARVFLERVAEAIAIQKATLTKAEDLENQKRDVWQASHLKTENLKELLNRYKKEEERIFNKAEQKLLDEWASRLKPPRNH